MSIHDGRYRHGLSAMVGRNTTDTRRAATPLELLYDLTFVAAFGVAASELAHGIVEGHASTAAVAFLIAMATITWAWTNFTWLASAFDNDDWLFRLLTMVQMAGVLVVTIGLPSIFASLEEDGTVDNALMVAGYIVIRLAVAAQWVRAARDDPRYRRLSRTYALFVGSAQAGWVLLAVLHLAALPALVAICILILIESLAPIVSEWRGRSTGGVTPWNSHHLAERYSLLTIIALGETVLGTLASATDITGEHEWRADAVVAIATSLAISLALWWIYFLVPHASALGSRRGRVLPWAYGHIVLFSSIAATGAGLHLVGYTYDPAHPLAVHTVVTAVAVPVLVFMVTRGLLHGLLTSAAPRPLWLHVATLLLPVAAVLLAGAGTPMWVCLLITLASPLSVVVAFEAGGWRALDQQLSRALETRAAPER